MIKAIAIDDEPIALKVIENFCHEIEVKMVVFLTPAHTNNLILLIIRFFLII
jgi:hypothetical protein